MNHNVLANSYDISFVLPSLDPIRWPTIYTEMIKAVGEHSFEIIIVSPNYPTLELHDKKNVKFIRDFGCPSRCFQLGTTIAVGRYLTSLSEDVLAEKGVLGEYISFLDTQRRQDCVSLTYSEGPGYTGDQDKNPYYWRPYTHDALRFIGINPNWTMCINPLIRTDFYREMGGIDCVYETLNMNVHDLMFRVQFNGGIVYLSRKIYSVGHQSEVYAEKHGAIQYAWEQVDMPRFKEKYNNPHPPMEPIDYNNWMQSPNIWHRRSNDYLDSPQSNQSEEPK